MFVHHIKFSYWPGCNPNTLHQPSFQRPKQSQLYNNKITFIKKTLFLWSPLTNDFNKFWILIAYHFLVWGYIHIIFRWHTLAKTYLFCIKITLHNLVFTWRKNPVLVGFSSKIYFFMNQAVAVSPRWLNLYSQHLSASCHWYCKEKIIIIIVGG